MEVAENEKKDNIDFYIEALTDLNIIVKKYLHAERNPFDFISFMNNFLIICMTHNRYDLIDRLEESMDKLENELLDDEEDREREDNV